MAINEWWADKPEQRFWMEATERPDLGADLHAPQSGTAGQSHWAYDLVQFTKPGDVVFHWHTEMFKRPSLVGWSEVVGPHGEGVFDWAPKGGTQKGVDFGPKPHWTMGLAPIHYLDAPISLDDIREYSTEILAVRSEIEQANKGSIYFPFTPHPKEGVRAMEGYLTKFPAELVSLFESHFDLELEALETGGDVDDERPPSVPAAGKQGVVADVVRRLAIERHAVERAKAHYLANGATKIVELGKPYDLDVHYPDSILRVEVKGSSGNLAAVIVTRNEVDHAHDHYPVDLFVVDLVKFETVDGNPVTSGGRVRRWVGWQPTPDTLKARTFDHSLSAGWEDIA